MTSNSASEPARLSLLHSAHDVMFHVKADAAFWHYNKLKVGRIHSFITRGAKVRPDAAKMSDRLNSTNDSNNCHPPFIIHFEQLRYRCGFRSIRSRSRREIPGAVTRSNARNQQTRQSRGTAKQSFKWAEIAHRGSRDKETYSAFKANNTRTTKEQASNNWFFPRFPPAWNFFRYRLISSYLRHSLNYTFSTLVRRRALVCSPN